MIDFTDYITLPVDKLLHRLGQVCSDLAGTYEEHAFTKSSEIQAKAAAWGNSNIESVTAREKTAVYSAASITSTLMDLEGKIKALIEERDYLRMLVAHASG